MQAVDHGQDVHEILIVSLQKTGSNHELPILAFRTSITSENLCSQSDAFNVSRRGDIDAQLIIHRQGTTQRERYTMHRQVESLSPEHLAPGINTNIQIQNGPRESSTIFFCHWTQQLAERFEYYAEEQIGQDSI